MFGLRGPCGLDMVNQALRKKIAYWAEKEKEEENTRDRSVPDGSDNKHDVIANYTRTMMSLNAMSHCALLPGSENMRAPVHGNQLLNHKKDGKNLR